MKADGKMHCNLQFILLLLILPLAVATGQSNDRWADSLSSLMHTARTKNLPVEALENKIREGRAKGRSTREIYTVIRKRNAALSEIAREHGGTIPAGYSYKRELYTRERILLRHPMKQLSPASAEEDRQRKKADSHTKPKPDKVTAIPHNDSENDIKDTNNAKVRKRIEKQITKADKINKKAIKQVQKRVDKAQKRMRKRATRQRGKR